MVFSRVLVFTAVILVTFVLARLVNAVVRTALRAVPVLTVDQAARLATLFVWLVGLLVAVNQLGLVLDVLLLLIALGGIFVVVGLRDLLPNLFSKVLVGVYLPFKKGDEIQIGKYAGKVIEINQVTTLLLGSEGSLIAVPNSLFLKQVLVNKTSVASRRLTIPVSIPATISLPEAEAAILKQVYKYRANFDHRFPPMFTVKKFGQSSVDAEIELVVANPENRDALISELTGRISALVDQMSSRDEKGKR